MTMRISKGKSYNLSARRPDTDKYWTYGRLEVNKFDNWAIGMKVTEELQELVEANKGGWINFGVYEREAEKTEGKHTARVKESRETEQERGV